MKILLVEDDEIKSRQIEELITGVINVEYLLVTHSVNEAMTVLSKNTFDLAIIDMSLPTYDLQSGDGGWRPQNFGGREIIRYIDRLDISLQVIVVTQFEMFGSDGDKMDIATLDEKLKEEYAPMFLGTVFFSHINEKWCDPLEALLLEAFAMMATKENHS